MECHQNDDALVIGYRPQSVANNVVSVPPLSIYSFYMSSCHARHVSVSFIDDDALKTSVVSLI